MTEYGGDRQDTRNRGHKGKMAVAHEHRVWGIHSAEGEGTEGKCTQGFKGAVCLKCTEASDDTQRVSVQSSEGCNS